MSHEETTIITEPPTSGSRTAKEAKKILVKNYSVEGFRETSDRTRRNLLVAFAKQGKVIYGKAFDLVKCSRNLNLDSRDEIRKQELDQIEIIEVKATRNSRVRPGFGNYFFSLSTAELLTAQSLGNQYHFVFVNIRTNEKCEMTLHQILSKAKNFYPTWSVTF